MRAPLLSTICSRPSASLTALTRPTIFLEVKNPAIDSKVSVAVFCRCAV